MTSVTEKYTSIVKSLLEEFGKEYLKSYAKVLCDDVRRKHQKPTTTKKLHYRKPKKSKVSEVDNPLHGEVYVKHGQGPKDFTSWQKLFVVEGVNSLKFYASEKDYKEKKDPKETVNVCGYKVITDTTKFFKTMMAPLVESLGVSADEFPVGFSKYSWGLVHPQRKSCIFQFHEGVNPKCGCFGGSSIEPEDAGQENAKKRDEWVHRMERIVKNAKVRDTKSTLGKTFDRTITMLLKPEPAMGKWKNDGTEEELLVDVCMQKGIPEVRGEIVQTLKGPLNVKLLAFYKTRLGLRETTVKLIAPAWSGFKATAEKTTPTIEDTVKPIIAKVVEARQRLRTVLQGKASRMMEPLANRVHQFVDPVFKFFQNPIDDALEHNKEHLKKVVAEQTSKGWPADKAKKSEILSKVAPQCQSKIKSTSKSIIQPLSKLVSEADDFFCAFSPANVQMEIENALMQLIDAAAHTLDVKSDPANGQQPLAVLDHVLQDYDHDAHIVKKILIPGIINDLFVASMVDKLQDAISEIDLSIVPDEVKEYIDIASILEELLELLVEAPLNQLVQQSYPSPAAEALAQDETE